MKRVLAGALAAVAFGFAARAATRSITLDGDFAAAEILPFSGGGR